MLLSKVLYSGNLCNMKQLEQVMGQVARIDRLPEANTIEAIRILCQAWDTVDLFVHYAQRAKTATKVSYMLMLLIGLCASVATVTSINSPDLINDELRC